MHTSSDRAIVIRNACLTVGAFGLIFLFADGLPVTGVLSVMAERAQFMARQPGFISISLHRSLDGVRVIRVEVLLPAAVHAPRGRVDALLDGGVWHLFDQDANLQVLAPSIGTAA